MAIADGKVIIQIDADSKGFETDLNKVTVSANELGTKALKGLAAGVTAATAAFTAGTAAAIAAGSAYQTAFAQTMTIMDQSVVSAGDMSDAIIDLSNDTGTAATALSESVYNAISATGDTANAVSLVADSSKLATAGFADESSALSVLTTITNAYGMATTEASNISDSLIQTQNLGVTTVGQLASSMGKAIATASAYSINLSNLESAYVSLTKAGISTEESTTYLSSMFNELGDSGSDVAAIIQNQTGKSFGQLMKSGASLGDVLDILLQSVDGNTEALMNLWGSAEAGKAASAIAGQGVKTFNSNLEQLQHSTGLTEKAYQTMANTLSFQTDKLKTRITNLGTAVYEYFDDSLTEGVGSLSDAFLELTDSVKDGELSDKMEDISEGVANLIHTGSELAADVIPALINGASWVLDNGNTVITIIGGTTAAVLAYKAAVATVSLTVNPFGLAVAGAIAFTTAAVAASDILTKVSPEVQALNDSTAETSAATKALAEHLATVIAEYEVLQSETTSNKSANDNLITSVVQMASTYDGAASSAAAIQRIVEELNSAIPGLNLAFDEQTGTLNKTEAAMRAYNEQWAAQQDYDAAMEANAEAIAGVQTATDNLTKSQNDLEIAQKAVQDYWDKYSYNGDMPEMFARGWTEVQAAAVVAKNAVEGCQNELAQAGKVALRTGTRVTQYSKELDNATDAAAEFSDSTDDSTDALDDHQKQVDETTQSIIDIASAAVSARYSGGNLRDTYNELSKQLEKLKADGDTEAVALAEQKLKLLDVAATAQELGNAYGDMSTTIGISAAEIAGYLVATDTSFEEFQSSATTATSNVINGFEKVTTSVEMSLSTMRSNLEYNIQAQASWNDNMEALWNRAVASGDAGTMALVQKLYDMGVEGSTQVAQFVNMTDEQLAEWGGLFTEAGQEGAENAALGAAMAAGSLYNSGAAMGAEFGEGYASTDMSGTSAGLVDGAASGITSNESKVTAAGQNVGEALVTGLESQGASLKTSAAALATAAINIWTAKAGTFRTAGATAATSLAGGINSGSGTVSSAATSVAYAAQNAMRIGGWYSLGYNISAGVADGVSAGSYLITRAAQNAAQNALNAAKATLGVHSPSRVFRDQVGQMIPAGMAEGITLGAPKATAAVEFTADQLLAATRVALRPSGSMTGAQYVNNTISNSYFGGSSGGNIVLEAPVYLDGREIARASAKYTGRQMAYLEGL
nr:MAG TPA: minor tail protein [Caudoviricetes sp.]